MTTTIRIDGHVRKEDDGTFTSVVALHYCGELFTKMAVRGFANPSQAIRDYEKRIDDFMEYQMCTRFTAGIPGEIEPVDFSHLMTEDEILTWGVTHG